MVDVIKTSNIPQITVSRFIKMQTKLIVNAVRRGVSMTDLPPIYLVGPMGVGKSLGMQQLADEVAAQTGKKVNLVDMRLLFYSPADLLGMPTISEDRQTSEWVMPKAFQFDPSPDVINILFLDELSSCPQGVQAAAYQIVQNRAVSSHKFPSNTYVLAAGNRMVDKSVVYKMPKALANRMTHFEIFASVDDWCEWAIKNGIDHRIYGFVRFKNDILFSMEETDAFPTPRTWAMSSQYLDLLDKEEDENDVFTFISGTIGSSSALMFKAYCKTYAYLPKIADIFAGKPAPLRKTTPDVFHALTSAMIAYARAHATDYDQIETSIAYAEKTLPMDFVSFLLHGYFSINPQMKEIIKRMPAYRDLTRRKGALLNGTL